MNHLNHILEKIEEDKYDSVLTIIESIDFKMARNEYHFSNIQRIVTETNALETDDFSQSITMPLYFEMESLLISMRSTVDMLMHLLNGVYGLGLVKDVYINNVFKHPRLPSEIKNVLRKYTRTFDNPTWSFIYTSRNDIVHEKSIPQVLPIYVDLFHSEQFNVFFKWEGVDREIQSFLNQCNGFLKNFSRQLYENILLSL